MPPDSVTTTKTPIQIIATRLADPTATGVRAALRRMDPSTLSTPALQQLLAKAVPQERPDSDAAWALLVHCMALAAPGQHMGHDRLGTVLRHAGFAESRLVRLLSPIADLLVMLPRTVRFLVARGGALDGRDLWQLIHPAIRAMPDDVALERTRTRIARDYYRADPTSTPPAVTAENLKQETTP
jgi:CRISPR type I-E-associated protein CasB/Cse2